MARPEFDKVLIANRGEIAVRIIQGLREMGLGTVAVYSDIDRTALHVLMADEAVEIGPAPAAESYLVIEKLIDVAKRSGAEAIHPGYGFLAERANFAQACLDEGLVFVGPSTEAIRVMGDKLEARQTVMAAGVPVVPVTICGTRSLLRADSRFPHRGAVRVSIGAPILPVGTDWAAALKLRDAARAELLAHLGEPDLVREAARG